MSILDDDLTVSLDDIMHSLIIRYLKEYADNWVYEHYKDIKMYYKVDRRTGKLIQISKDSGIWYLMWDYVNQIIYVTKWVDSYHRYINNLSVLMHYDKNKNLYITLKDVIDEFTRY